MFSTKYKVFFGLSIYAVLVVHVVILFPSLSVFGQLFQALLRLLVLGLTVFATYKLYNQNFDNKYSFFKWILWLMIIPYPVYNIFQVRHIAEIFTLEPGKYFAPGHNVDFIWKCLPTLIYSFISGITGFFCIYVIAIKYFISLVNRLIFSTVIFSLACAAAIYGLHSRLDTYHLFTHTFLVFKDLLKVFSSQETIFNYALCTGLVILLYALLCPFFKLILSENGFKTIP